VVLLLLVVFFSCVAVAFAYLREYNGVNHGLTQHTELAFAYVALTDPPEINGRRLRAAITLTTGPTTGSASGLLMEMRLAPPSWAARHARSAMSEARTA